MIEKEEQDQNQIKNSLCSLCKISQNIQYLKLQRSKVVEKICLDCKSNIKDQYMFKKNYSPCDLIRLAFPNTASKLIDGSIDKINDLPLEIYKQKQIKINEKTLISEEFYQSLVYAELVHIVIDKKFIQALKQSDQLLQVIQATQNKCIILDLQENINFTEYQYISPIFNYIQQYSTQLFIKSDFASEIGNWQNVQHLSYDIDPFLGNSELLKIQQQFPSLKSIDCSFFINDTSYEQIYYFYEYLFKQIFKISQIESITLNILSQQENEYGDYDEQDLESQDESKLDNSLEESKNEQESQYEEESEEEIENEKHIQCEEIQSENGDNNYQLKSLNNDKCIQNQQGENQIADAKNWPLQNEEISMTNEHSEGEYGQKETKSQSSDDENEDQKKYNIKDSNNYDEYNFSQIEEQKEQQSQNNIQDHLLIKNIKNMCSYDQIFNFALKQQKINLCLNNLKSLSIFQEQYQEDVISELNILNGQFLQFLANHTGKITYLIMDIHLSQQNFPNFIEIFKKNKQITDLELSLDNLNLNNEQIIELFKMLHTYQLTTLKINLQEFNHNLSLIIEQIGSLIKKNCFSLKNLEIYLIQKETQYQIQDLGDFCKENFFYAISQNPFPNLRNICLIIDKQNFIIIIYAQHYFFKGNLMRYRREQFQIILYQIVDYSKQCKLRQK
ncbi:hypothetical protein ABPG74_016170 [Tetrahymena malaccensis]